MLNLTVNLQKLIQFVLEVVPVSGTAVSEPDEGGVGVRLHTHRPVAQSRIASYEGLILLELRGIVVQGLVPMLKNFFFTSSLTLLQNELDC